MMPQQIGQLLDTLGVEQDLEDGDLISDAIVISKVVDANGHLSLGIAVSESCSWIDQLGMLTAASDIIRNGGYRQCDHDDD
jgi:hypothetical protein